MGILEIKNLSFEAESKKILDNLNMDFMEGYIYAIVGPNGAGKSTLAYVIMGLSNYRNAQGDVFFKGENIKQLQIFERARRGITLSWQEPARFEGLGVKKFLEISARDKSLNNLKNAMIRVGMEPDEYFPRAVDRTLSGGERRRIEIASILVMEPELVILDEPDSSIDIAAIERIFEIIIELKQKGTTVILITHSLAVLEKAEFAFLICNGKLVDSGPVDQIVEYYKNRCLPCEHKNIPY